VARQPQRHEGGRRRARDQGVPDGGRPGRLIRLREELGGGQLDHFDGGGGGGRGEGARGDLVGGAGDAVVGDEHVLDGVVLHVDLEDPLLLGGLGPDAQDELGDGVAELPMEGAGTEDAQVRGRCPVSNGTVCTKKNL